MSERSSQPPGRDLLNLPLDALPDPLLIPPLAGAESRGEFMVAVRPPGSKSLTNRALLLAALADGQSTLAHALLEADDTERMIFALTQLGARIERQDESTLRIQGVGGRWRPRCGGPAAAPLTLDLNNAGTATRFLAAAALLSPAPLTIDGNARMRERPIGQLIEPLRQLGASASYLAAPGHPPVTIVPPAGLGRGQRLEIPTTLSSQFISALLLIAPWLPGGLTIIMQGEVTSASYIHMTLGLLAQLGASVKSSEDLRVIRVGPSPGGPGLAWFTCDIEPDASSATYFWAAAALFPGSSCKVRGLGPGSLQPDARFPDLLARMGAAVIRDEDEPSITVRGPLGLDPIMADLSMMPDAAMTLAAVACFATGRSILRGLRTLRVKETDRIAALERELTKIGVQVETSILGDRDALTISPPPGGIDASPAAPPVHFDTYDDHRMAMSLALIALKRPNTFIRNPRCVAKTYPGFWRDLAMLYR
jgi:3-phosphoshikimate 1-carboxyvinyltransferase